MTFNSIIENEVHNLFSSAFGGFSLPAFKKQLADEGYPVSNVAVSKDSTSILIEIACTGFSKEEIKVSLDGRVIIVRGEVAKETNNDFYYIHKKIKSKKSFERSYLLPQISNLEAISISYNDGLLSITVPLIKDEVAEKLLTF